MGLSCVLWSYLQYEGWGLQCFFGVCLQCSGCAPVGWVWLRRELRRKNLGVFIMTKPAPCMARLWLIQYWKFYMLYLKSPGKMFVSKTEMTIPLKDFYLNTVYFQHHIFCSVHVLLNSAKTVHFCTVAFSDMWKITVNQTFILVCLAKL